MPSLPTSPVTGIPLPGIRPNLEPPNAPPPPSAAPAPAKPSPTPKPDDGSEAITALLHVYEEASDRLDVNAAAALWRRPDMRELHRAFSSLSSQDVTFDKCFLAVADARATANCQGAVTFVPRVGAPVSRTRKLTWVIELSRTDGRWLIEKVTASESR